MEKSLPLENVAVRLGGLRTLLGSVCLQDNPVASMLPARRLLTAIYSEGLGEYGLSSITPHEPFHSLSVFGSATKPPGPLLKCHQAHY